MKIQRGVLWSALLLAIVLLVPLTVSAQTTRVDPHAVGVTTIGTLAGTVRDSQTGSPVAGATVTAMGPIVHSRQTNASGQYTMSLPSGTYSIRVSHTNYLNAWKWGVVVSSGTTTTADFQLVPR